MGKAFKIKLREEIDAPQQVVWEAAIDHEGMADWLEPLEAVQLLRDGKPKNGMGAIRVLMAPIGEFANVHERVIYFNPPHSYQYEITKGVPGLEYHLGQVRVHSNGRAASIIEWTIDFEFKYLHPMIIAAPAIVKGLEYGLELGLAKLRRQLEH
ncbi:MAG: SRPBCC family protein [Aureispira sp.]|nr:SRPBCC family protein [Aureispira sp.]